MIKSRIKVLNLLILWLVINFFYPKTLFSQKVDTSVNARKIWFWFGSGVGYITGMTFLYHSWYKGYSHSSFHWFDDFAEWKQMDKMGHFFSSFQIANAYSNGLKWNYYEPQKAVLYGSLASFITVSSIEVFDGFSSKWGASYSDLIANMSGALLYLTQAYYLDKIPIQIKFSFHYTHFANMRPDALGKNKLEQIVKDYNGQTYWLSINPHLMGLKKCPSWLSMALGYGASGMIVGNYNLYQSNDNITIPLQPPYRRFFLSLDFNPSKLDMKCKFFTTFLRTFNVIKLPLPTLEFQKGKVQGKWLYF